MPGAGTPPPAEPAIGTGPRDLQNRKPHPVEPRKSLLFVQLPPPLELVLEVDVLVCAEPPPEADEEVED